MTDRGNAATRPVKSVQKSPSPVAPGLGYASCVFPRTTSRSSSNALSASPVAQTPPYDAGYRSPLAGRGFTSPPACGVANAGFAPAHQYAPPPPMPHQRRANIFDEDANLEATFLPTQNPNRSIPASLSPNVEDRYPPLGCYRPVSATRPKTVSQKRSTPGQSNTVSSRDPRTLQRAASSVAPGFHPKPEKVILSDRCGALVCDRDPSSGAVLAQYQCGAQLGKGGFANVFEFIDLSTRVVYACKVIDRSKLTRHSESGVMEEVDIHSRMNHPNVVRLVKFFNDDHYFYILLERCSTKNLMDISNARGAFGNSEIQHVIRQLCSAVEYVHKCGVIHRDIKLGNIMLDFDGNVKLGDFGFAGWLGPNERKSRMCGTPNYMAPEVLLCSETRQGYDFAADMWSLGVVLFILTCGYPPFQSKDIPSTYERIKRADYTFPSSGSTASCSSPTRGWRQIIVGLLQRDPSQRLTMAQLTAFPLLRASEPAQSAPRSLVPSHEERSRGSFTGRAEEHMVSPIATSGSPCAWGNGDAGGASRLVPSRHAGDYVFDACLPSYRERSPLCAPFTTISPQVYSERADVRGHQRAMAVAAVRPRPIVPCHPSPPPPPPEAVMHASVYFSKYGHGFLIGSRGRDVPVVLLNDRSKLVYDYTQDVVVYYARIQTVQEQGVKTYCDDPHVFVNAREKLGRNTRPTEACDDAILSAASKKYAITLFLLPYLRRPTVDIQIPCRSSTLPVGLTDPAGSHGLFTGGSALNEQRAPVYVKDVHMSSLSDFTDRYPDAQVDLMAVRLSNDSYQISVRCLASCPSSLMPMPENCAIERNGAWTMDLLLYGNGHALLGIETEHMRIHLSFTDFAASADTTCGGRVFTASGQSSSSSRIELPGELLETLAAVLRKVHGPSDAILAAS